VIVSPVRDEAGRVEQTIASLVRQTVRPVHWILVDDGSRDGTGMLVDRAAREHQWITAVHRPSRDRRGLLWAAEIAAFHEGFRTLQVKDWEFVVKLDGDLVLPSDYFECCLQQFLRDPRLGIGGGTLYHMDAGRKIIESSPRYHVRGATKIYRRECWQALGGPPNALAWDTVDELRAQMLGWTTRTFPEVHALHLRPTGSADGAWANGVKDGRAAYATGYHPLFMFLKVARRVTHPPYGVISAALLCGFASGYLRRLPRSADPALIRFVRRQQIRRLLGQNTIWR
jgi:glycosyltransferase involved in cell wall biosynthesis